MKELKAKGGVCFAPVYSNGTGHSHLYAAAMDRCCEGGTEPVQLGPKGNAPWSDDDEILCGRQCLQVEEWPEKDADRYLEMRRFGSCMRRMMGFEDFGTNTSTVRCDIDDDLLWDGANDGIPPKGVGNSNDEDEDEDEGNGGISDSDNRLRITGDGKTCPGPRRDLEEVFGLSDSEDVEPQLGADPESPYCTIAVLKKDADWTRDVFKNCCSGDLGSFPPWAGEVDDVNCNRLCQIDWDNDGDEDSHLERLKELNKCFLGPSWSEDNGRRPFIACYGLGNLTLESADPAGQKSAGDSNSTDNEDENSNEDDDNDNDNGGSGGSGDDDEDAAARWAPSGVSLGVLWLGWTLGTWLAVF